MTSASTHARLAIRHPVGCALIIQTILLDPSGAVWTDEASNVSRPDPSGADQSDVEHQATELAVGASDQPIERAWKPSSRPQETIRRGRMRMIGSSNPSMMALPPLSRVIAAPRTST